MGKTVLLFALALGAGLFSGCGTVCYYAQAIGGQLDILAKRRPIPTVLADPAVPPGTKQKLRQVQKMRAFARDSLALPVGGQYESFVQLDRPFVVYNVFAAPRLSLKPKTWCYPLVGCLAYRGYFARADARQLARELAAQGLEVYLGGVPAYSTLGWFNDPVLSSMTRLSADQLAEIIFHELAHKKLFVKGDTAFNEGFATAVGQEGARRFWGGKRPESQTRRGWQQVRGILLACRARLQTLYKSPLPRAEKLMGKKNILDQARASFAAARQKNPALARFAPWFGPGLNNAFLSSLATYQSLAPGFAGLLSQNNGDLPAFYRAARQLSLLPPPQRRLRLLRLAAP